MAEDTVSPTLIGAAAGLVLMLATKGIDVLIRRTQTQREQRDELRIELAREHERRIEAEADVDKLRIDVRELRLKLETIETDVRREEKAKLKKVEDENETLFARVQAMRQAVEDAQAAGSLGRDLMKKVPGWRLDYEAQVARLRGYLRAAGLDPETGESVSELPGDAADGGAPREND